MRAADLRAGDVLRHRYGDGLLTVIEVSASQVFVFDPKHRLVVYAWFDSVEEEDRWEDWIDLEQWWIKL
jgi:hypothetical protein